MVVTKEDGKYVGKIKFRGKYIYIALPYTDLRAAKQNIQRARDLLGKQCTAEIKPKIRKKYVYKRVEVKG